MRTVDKFSSKQFNRINRNSKVIYQFSKYGSKGLSKINPTLVFVDAVISLGELYISYSAYRQVKEQNKQLEVELETLSIEFGNFKRNLQLNEDKFKYELQQKSNFIEKKLNNNKESYKILKKSYESSKIYFFKMKNEVEKYKKEFPYSKETKDIEKKYYEVLFLYTEISLNFIGG